MDLYLHAVVIRKPNSLPIARKKAQEWIRNKNRRHYKESDECYVFRNLPKKHFESLEFHKYDDETYLAYGKLKDITE